jgi:hypothetical protein
MILLANRITRVTVLTGRADPNEHTETVLWTTAKNTSYRRTLST